MTSANDFPSSGGERQVAIQCMFGFTIIALSGILKLLERSFHLPHTLVLFVLTTLGSYGYTFTADFTRIATDATNSFSESELLVVFLPALAFHATHGINFYVFRRCLVEILLFAVGTTVINTYIMMEYNMAIMRNKFGRLWCFILGALQTCTERVSVADSLLNKGKHPMIATILNVETLVSAILSWDMLSIIIRQAQSHKRISVLPLLLDMNMSMVLSGACGLLCALLVKATLHRCRFQPQSMVVFVVASSYALFALLKLYGGCGILGVIFFCVMISTDTLITSTGLEDELKRYWEVLHDTSEVISLLLCALYIGHEITPNVNAADISTSLLTYLVAVASRAVSVVCMLPFLSSVRSSSRLAQALILIWLGMRGSYRIFLAVHYLRLLKVSIGEATRGIVHVASAMVLVDLINVMLFENILTFIARNVAFAAGYVSDSELERLTLRNALRYLRHTSRVAAHAERAEARFVPVDWRWVTGRTYVTDLRKQSAKGSTAVQLAAMRDADGVGNEHPIENFSADQEAANMKAYEFAIENAIRIQRVSYQKQYRSGMIQKKTEARLLAALQYPYESKTYLNIDMIRQLIAVPPWVNWLVRATKSLLKSGSGGDDFGCDGLADRGEGGEYSFEMSIRERVVEVFEHPRYDLVQCSVTVSAAACLGGVLLLPMYDHRVALLAIGLQTAYLAAFATEMSIMVFVYGQRFVRMEQYNLLDLLLVVGCSGLYGLQLALRVVDGRLSDGTVGMALATLFLCAMLMRLVHLTQYGEDLVEWVISLIHQYMDSIIYAAYETGLALIKGEEDVRENIWKTVDEFMADQIRCHAGENRLEVLRQVVEVHSKYPGVAVAFKSRQACQSILNDVRRHIDELLHNGAMDTAEHRKMITAAEEAMQQVMSAPYSFPSSYKPISVLRAVPWMGTDQLRQFLAMSIRPVSYDPGVEIIHENEDTSIVVATSGIVKVSGEVTENVDGALPNTASFLYFYSDGYFEDYILAPDIIGTLSIVSDEPCVTTVTAETAVNAYLIPKERLLEALEVFTAWPSFRYQLWYFICSTLSTPLLQSQPQYQTWPTEKVNNRLERMQMPDLMNAKQFQVSQDIEDLLLIQGRIMDATTEEEYLAPMYIPRTVTKIIFPGEVYSRPCPVMVIIANEQYTLPEEVDWVLREQRRGDDNNEQRAAAATSAGFSNFDEMTYLSRATGAKKVAEPE
ncbi:sperm-specific sodium:proton exchanger-like [Dermacentor variabilis]|uniref:sperm-specific sodium:proton exchanger-like n=1 Tax=Dermacentor variabilis TaxID=34621 RepID=UPI003F5BFA3F